MSEIHDALLDTYLQKYGRHYQSGQLFYHRQLGQRLRHMGFDVLSIHRLATHPVWKIRLRQWDHSLHFLKPFGLFERRLKASIRQALRQLGRGVKGDEIVVVGSGIYYQVVFVWPVGRPGTWRPPPDRHHPFRMSLMVRPWLREQRN